VTGVEPLITPFLSKAAAAGASRAAGWSAKTILESRRKKKVRELIPDEFARHGLDQLEDLPPESLSRLLEFLKSPELEHTATALSRAYLLEGAGKKTDQLLRSIHDEFNASLCAWMHNDPCVGRVGGLILDGLTAAVVHSARQVLDSDGLSVALQAELIKTVGSISAASTRNASLLRSLSNLHEVLTFEKEYRNQIVALHGTMRLPHAGTTRQIPYDQLFVSPNLRLPKVPESGDRSNQVSLDQLLAHSTRVIVLGDPGGGKSTLSLKLTFDVASNRLSCLSDRIPFLVVLRDYATVVRGKNRRTLVEYLDDICKSPYNIDPPRNALDYLLLNDRAVVILDGLDELLETSLRRDVVQAVEGFAHRYPTCPIVVTSRRVGYEEAPLDPDLFVQTQLDEFDDQQVREYVRNWFNLDESVPYHRRDQLTESFYTDSEFVSDLRANPLMLSLMCGIYASENYIPRNRPDVYEKCALLLFERWDKQRGIHTGLPFDAHVQAAMRSLALYMYTRKSSGGLPRTKLIQYMTTYLREKRFDDDETAEAAATDFIDFCKGRAWVLTDVGSEIYGFTHRTFLEYFAASQLVRLNPSADALFATLSDYLAQGSWDVVAQLAVQILGRAVEDGADDFLQLVVERAQGRPEQASVLLSFTARALQFVVPRPSVIREVVDGAVRLFLDDVSSGDYVGGLSPASDLLRCSTENLPRVARALRDALRKEFQKDSLNERAMFLALLHPVHSQYFREATNEHFWANFAQENRREFSEIVALQQSKYYWVGVTEFEFGDLPLRALVDYFGLRCLYEFRVAGYTFVPPFAFRFAQRHRGGFSGLLEPNGGAKRTSEISREIVAELHEKRTPWLRYRSDYKRSVFTLTVITDHGNKIKDPALLLLALPLIELAAAGWSVPNIDREDDSLVGSLLMARERGSTSAKEKAVIEPWLPKEPNIRRFLAAWISGDISVVSHVPKKREVSDRAVTE
jgi:hypothetical protein